VSAILKLTKGDTVRDSAGRTGTVVGFDRDHVHVAWEGGMEPWLYTDDGLRAHGIVKTSPADALRPVARR
jgi:hypothetical protein